MIKRTLLRFQFDFHEDFRNLGFGTTSFEDDANRPY